MGIINVLPSEIFNRIAAGEVVEKPASIVKELVENSIDAGASRISIEINDGGKEIKVIDDGCGMDEIDISSAFLPHATSKISSLSDLDEISTLGFRGEAIPSIAAVSNVTIISRREEDELGCIVNSVNGHAARPEKCGAKKGTTVHVKDLFKNIPARLKFLRKDKTEENDIISLTDKLILANFNVSFQLVINGKEVRSSSGKGLNEAVFAVYGRDYLKENDYVNATMSGITLYGYINKPAFSKHNRNFQTLIVNGRYVVNQDISFWIYNSFSSFLMKRQYPAYVLFIDLPADMIDINVHPSKIEIKFIDINTIKKLLSSVIYASLEKGASQPKEITLDKVVEKKEVPIVKEEPAKIESAKIKSSFINAPESRKSFFDNAIKVKSTPEDELIDRLIGNKISKKEAEIVNKKELPKEIKEENTEFFEELRVLKYNGKLFNTYIILEAPDYFVLIDQHAAHERILYERFKEQVESNKVESQIMFFPFVFDLDFYESEMLESNLKEINKLGFEISKLSGNSYSLSAYPSFFDDFDPDKFVLNLVASLNKGSVNKMSFIKEDIMQMSCKAAVKGEMDLSEMEIKQLIEDIKTMKIDLFCPHGRPIAIKFTKAEVEKWFKRIV